MSVLVTGCAGFIGAATSQALLQQGNSIIGVDNLNSYYDVRLKQARLARLRSHDNFQFYLADLADIEALNKIFKQHTFESVVHLAAQAGVRYSLTDPKAYINSNLLGFAHLLENCRQYQVAHLLFASSSSVYGNTKQLPLSVEHSVTDKPLNLYAATKKSNEVLAYSYAHLYGLAATGLRYFTVYGPWGRPDMAPFLFTQNILNQTPIQVFNQGQHHRDFTYIDDAVAATLQLLTGTHFSKNNHALPYKLYNVAYGECVALDDLITLIERNVGKAAIKQFKAQQAGDVGATWADISALVNDIGYQPRIPLAEGISRFTAWFKSFYSI